MNNNITELVFILDKSGSMAGLEKDTVGGFNAMIERQKQLDGKVFVSTVLFSNTSEVIHDRLDIREVKPLEEKDYPVGGCTALMDALGDAIHHIRNIHKYGRKEDVPEHTIFVITTDGMENASRRFSADRVRRMISEEQERSGWEFLFLAANIDAVETAARYGIREDRASNYRASAKGTNEMYDCVAEAVVTLRSNRKLGRKWNERLDPDKTEST